MEACQGGVGSAIAGGSFWDGAAQGLITGGLNHAADKIMYQLNKADLIRAAKKSGLCTICNEQEVGFFFEVIVARELVKSGFIVTPGTLLQTTFGNTVPDFFIALAKQSGGLNLFGGIVEVKAKNSGTSLSLSDQNYQIFKQILAANSGWYNGRGTYTLVTTGGVKVSRSIRLFASGLLIRSHHLSATYSGSLSIKNISFKTHY